MAKKMIDRGIFTRPDREGFWVQIVLDGRRRTFKTRTVSQARILYHRLQTEKVDRRLNVEKYRAKAPLTVKEWVERCLAGSSNRDKQKERQRMEYWAALWGNRSLTDLDEETIRLQRAKMQAEGKLKDSTVNRYMSALRRMLSLAVRKGLLSDHPMAEIEFLKEIPKNRYFTDVELARLQQLLPVHEWRMVSFALGTGLRLGEQLGLTWKDINWDRSVATVPLSKSGKSREVTLSHATLNLLREQFSESPYVFPDPFDPLKPADVRKVSAHFASRLRQCGIQGASWHVLRHSFASRLLQHGADIVTVSQLLGHSNIVVTQRYAHPAKDAKAAAVNGLNISDFQTTTTTTTKIDVAGNGGTV